MNGEAVKVYSKTKNGSQTLSSNFKVKEFACNDSTDTIFVSPKLVEILQKIRDHFKKPVTITSGYRTDAYNKRVGGATYSQHKYGTAADIMVSNTAPLDVALYTETLLPNSGGIGLYGGFTHVDVRANRSRWDSRSGKEISVNGF